MNDDRHLEINEDKEQLIPSDMRVKQLEVLEIYGQAAMTDETMKGFLINMGKKLNRILIQVGAAHKKTYED